jgi:hypothetical protein
MAIAVGFDKPVTADSEKPGRRVAAAATSTHVTSTTRDGSKERRHRDPIDRRIDVISVDDTCALA